MHSYRLYFPDADVRAVVTQHSVDAVRQITVTLLTRDKHFVADVKLARDTPFNYEVAVEIARVALREHLNMTANDEPRCEGVIEPWKTRT
jgi:hypothetical protein